MEGNLLGSPRAVDGQEALPIIHLSREVLGCNDSSQGHHHKFDIGNGHASPLCLLLGILVDFFPGSATISSASIG